MGALSIIKGDEEITSSLRPTELFDPEGADFKLGGYRIFSSIPEYHHGIVALLGRVLVYDTEGLFRERVEDGALYVVEYQNPVSRMSWEQYDRLNREFTDRRVRIETTRRVIRAVRNHLKPELWYHALQSGWTDGPFEEWNVMHNFVGKVVGLYRPDFRPN